MKKDKLFIKFPRALRAFPAKQQLAILDFVQTSTKAFQPEVMYIYAVQIFVRGVALGAGINDKRINNFVAWQVEHEKEPKMVKWLRKIYALDNKVECEQYVTVPVSVVEAK